MQKNTAAMPYGMAAVVQTRFRLKVSGSKLVR